MKKTERSPNSTLRRSTKPMKRSSIKRKSKDTAKDDNNLDKIRKAWRLTFKRCHICNRRPPESVHEILGGSKWRHITKFLPCFWLAVCDGPYGCHRIIQSNSEWPPARQLAHKLTHDPKGFDLLEFNRTTAGTEKPIAMSEVDSWADLMQED